MTCTIPSRSGSMRRPRTASMSTNRMRPPSSAGMGSRLVSPSATLMNAAIVSSGYSVRPSAEDSAASPAIWLMPTMLTGRASRAVISPLISMAGSRA